jgi:hypothetical protein
MIGAILPGVALRLTLGWLYLALSGHWFLRQVRSTCKRHIKEELKITNESRYSKPPQVNGNGLRGNDAKRLPTRKEC